MSPFNAYMIISVVLINRNDRGVFIRRDRLVLFQNFLSVIQAKNTAHFLSRLC